MARSNPRSGRRQSRRRGATPVTLRDVARAVRVAASTVSRALAGDARISPATRREVERAARRLGYAPNALARGLAGGGADVLAVVVPRTAEYTFTSPFHLAALKGVSRVLQESGHLLLLSFLEDRDYVALHRSGLCRGVIVLMSRTGDRRIAALARHRVPTVLIPGRCLAAGRHVAHLRRRREHRRGHAASPGPRPSPDRVRRGRAELAPASRPARRVPAGLAAGGVAVEPALEAETNFTAAEAYDRALELLGARPAPDRAALQQRRDDRRRAGRRAAPGPERCRTDLSLVSLAGLPGPRPAAPAMARVILDFEQAGATAATLLLKLVADPSAPAEAVLLPAEFDPRGSIAPPG